MREKIRKILVRLAKAVTLVATILLAAWWILDAIAAQRAVNAVNELKVAGFATSLRRLARDPAPDWQNAAPIYLAADGLFTPRAVDDTETADAIDAALDNRSGDDERYAGFMSNSCGYRSLTEEDRRKVRDWLEKNAVAFDLIRMARRRPHCRYFTIQDLPLHDPAPDRLPRSSWQYLSLRAQACAVDGRVEEAFECVRDILQSAEGLRDEPLKAAQTCRAEAHNVAFEAVENIVASTTSIGDLRCWLKTLPPENAYDGTMAAAARGELADYLDVFTSTDDRWQFDFPFNFDKSGPIDRRIARPFVLLDIPRGSQMLRRLAEAASLPPQEALRALKGIESENEQATWWACWTRFSLTIRLWGFNRQILMQARLRVLRRGLELEIERQEQGRYPDSVETLDPITGTPLRYKPAEGFLYSVGEDGEDDGGDPEKDIVWRLRRAGPR